MDSLISPRTIGRQAQIDTLCQMIERAQQGEGSVAIISGEAGIGKSRLVAEMIYRASEAGLTILQGNCFESDSTFPYAPLIDLLQAFYAKRPHSDIAPELAPILPELVSPSQRSTLDPTQAKRRLFYALAEFFHARANPASIIVIEDLHWCDETSLDFLLYLARHLAQQPNLLLLTLRTDESNAALNHFLGALDRLSPTTELALAPLLPTQVDEMLRAIFSLNRPVGFQFLESLYALTEGNPFFIEEILKSLAYFHKKPTWDQNVLEWAQIPRSAQEAVQRRVSDLSKSARATLETAAVVGRRFDLALLHKVVKLDEGTTLQAIKELVAAQLVVEESVDHFSFRHALTREAVYSSLLRSERKRIHHEILETLELSRAGLETRTNELAYHSFQAEAWKSARHYSAHAGNQALKLFAPREAAGYFSQALTAERELGQTQSVELLRLRGQAYEMLGEFNKARTDYAITLEAAREEKNPTAEWQALLNLGFLWASRDYRQTGEYFQRALTLARTMHDASILARSLNRLGNWCLNIEKPLEGIIYHREAIALVEGRDTRAMAETLDLLGLTSVNSGDLIKGEQFYRQAIAHFRELDHRTGLVSALATIPMCSGDYHTNTMVAAFALPKATRECDEALHIAREIGFRSGEAYALTALALCLGTQGEYGRALDSGNAALAIAEEIEHQQWTTRALVVLGAIHLDLQSFKQAREYLERAAQKAREINSLLFIRTAAGFLAQLDTQTNEFAHAKEILDAAIAPDAPSQTLGERHCWIARGELALERGEPKRALEIAEQLIATATHRGEGAIPRLEKLRGEALGALNKYSAAVESLHAARDGAMAHGVRPLAWRIHAALGKLHRDHRREQAEVEFSAARGIVVELAATIANEELREHFIKQAYHSIPAPRAPSPRRVAKQLFGGLTERERGVAALIAQGKSNQEIAEKLVLSEHTIATHVGNILNKLGFNSRTQIAAWAIDKGLRKSH